MRKITVGIVDYGVGNHASVRQCLHYLGLRCRVSFDPAVLASCDLILLPGVGAFPLAMQALKVRSLNQFVIEQANKRPILGICLGMQLLTEASHEGSYTEGLGLIPGETVPLGEKRWHIGWNTVMETGHDPLFRHESDDAFFFNHSFAYRGPAIFQAGKTDCGIEFASIIRRETIVGVQFHPEKSQKAGQELLRQLVHGLCNA